MSQQAKERRKRILEAACQLTLQKGLYGFSQADLSKATGIPKGSVSYLVGSKENLQVKALKYLTKGSDIVSIVSKLSPESLRLLEMIVEFKLKGLREDLTEGDELYSKYTPALKDCQEVLEKI